MFLASRYDWHTYSNLLQQNRMPDLEIQVLWSLDVILDLFALTLSALQC